MKFKSQFLAIDDEQDQEKWLEFFQKTVGQARQWGSPMYHYLCCWRVRGRDQSTYRDTIGDDRQNEGHELVGKSLLKVAGSGGMHQEIARLKAYLLKAATQTG